MSTTLPDSHKDLLEGPVYSVFTTINPDGIPENTVVWCSWDGTHVLVNTSRARRKSSNVEGNPNVALTAIDPKNPYRWVDVRGVVESVEPDDNYDNINYHAKLYAGADEYYGGVAPAEQRGTEERIILKVKPLRILAFPPQ